MHVMVDQSGKIEDTARPTIVAYSNGHTLSLKVEARVKRQLQEHFRRRGEIHLFIYRTFAALLFLLLRRDIRKINRLVIDEEYPGHETLIKDVILGLLRRHRLPEPSIEFKRIGNRPRVHYAAYNVFAGKKTQDILIRLEDILNLVIKKDRGLGRLKNA